MSANISLLSRKSMVSSVSVLAALAGMDGAEGLQLTFKPSARGDTLMPGQSLTQISSVLAAARQTAAEHPHVRSERVHLSPWGKNWDQLVEPDPTSGKYIANRHLELRSQLPAELRTTSTAEQRWDEYVKQYHSGEEGSDHGDLSPRATTLGYFKMGARSRPTSGSTLLDSPHASSVSGGSGVGTPEAEPLELEGMALWDAIRRHGPLKGLKFGPADLAARMAEEGVQGQGESFLSGNIDYGRMRKEILERDFESDGVIGRSPSPIGSVSSDATLLGLTPPQSAITSRTPTPLPDIVPGKADP